jgi:nitrate/nitrite transport system permease protein
MSSLSIKTKGTLLSVLIFIFILLLWHVSTSPKVNKSNTAATVSNTNSAEYNELMGNSLGNTVQKTGFPSLQQMGSTFYKQLAHPFYDNGPNDKGIGIN